MDWEEAHDHIEGYFEYTLGLESEWEKAIWTYVISVAVHLEYMAVLIHWHDAGQPSGFNEYGRGLTLAQAAFDLEARGLIGNETFAVLRDVAVLRNGLAHRHAYRQAAEQTGFRRQDRGIYRGRHVFTDVQGLATLMKDVDQAGGQMLRWLIVHDVEEFEDG